MDLLRFKASGSSTSLRGGLVALAALLILLSTGASLPVHAVPTPAPPQSSLPALPSGVPLSSYRLEGPAPPDLPVLVTFAIPLRNVGALDTLVTQVSDPSSPLYRHFITPAQAQDEFLPTASYDSLLGYLGSAGFSVEMTALDSVVVAQGTASQLASALHEGVNLYSNGTTSYYITSGPATFGGAYVYASNATYLFDRPSYSGVSAQGGNVTFTSESFSLKALQQVYNATSLYSRGDTGAGQTIGLLDFYGSPTVQTDLSQFDSAFGLPGASLQVTPVGPYDPNLGVAFGWSTEVSLDVEASHAMAPSASVDLYVANGALSLAAPLAQIVQDDKVTTLSQSFGIPEWYYSLTSYLGGPAFFAENAYIPDQYYALGSAQGISFFASSGDAGGSGYSTGPEGGLEYPASSPFVTSVGGTQTYLAASAGGGDTFVQTAWSNIGFVPNGVNQGGGGGGVSILEPKPWYQLSQPTPASYPNGRLNPDVSLQAGLDPATLIVDAGQQVGIGGTSVSTPLLAGLVSAMAESLNGSLGLINPFLYQAGNDPTEYPAGFDPITSGYTIPWTASYGYNLATGWGAPNVGELSLLAASVVPSPRLGIEGEIVNSTGGGQADFTQGQEIFVSVRINLGLLPVVSTGAFTVALQTLAGDSAPAAMSYDPITGNWTGSLTVGSQSGLAYVYVSGSSNGVPGQAMGVVFVGYLGSLIVPGSQYVLSTDPWSWGAGDPLRLAVNSTDLLGNPAPSSSVSLSLRPYSIETNAYGDAGALTLSEVSPGTYEGNLVSPAPVGPLSLVIGGSTYGYAPMVNGMYLQTTYIYPEVAAEPGSAAPGQYLTVLAAPIAPVNVYFETSYETGGTLGAAAAEGSNVTATLVTPNGTSVSTVALTYQACPQALRVCSGGAPFLYGELQVPASAAPGLYTVLLSSSFSSYTPGGDMAGSFYGQVLVTEGPITPKVTLSPSTLYQGERAVLKADIAYPNGTEVRYGEYTAVVYPASLQGQYTQIMHTAYASSELVPLSYDLALNEWVGNLTMPSPSSSGSISGSGGSPYGGTFDAFVTGLSSDGVPTTSASSAALGFFVQPYLFVTGTAGPPAGMASGLAFGGANISSPAALSGDIFLGSNTVSGPGVTVSTSEVDGTLIARGTSLTLVGVKGGDVVAYDSHLTILDSSLGSIELVNSTVSMQDSSYQSLSPSVPVLAVSGPAEGELYTGVSAVVNVTGDQVSSVSVTLDGAALAAFPGGQPSYTVPLNSGGLPDGVHVFTVVATQSDGMSSSASVTFATLGKLQSQVSSQKGSLGSLQTQADLELGVTVLFAVLALVLLVAALRRNRPPLSAGLP
jgi:subtilase family serine protease